MADEKTPATLENPMSEGRSTLRTIRTTWLCRHYGRVSLVMFLLEFGAAIFLVLWGRHTVAETCVFGLGDPGPIAAVESYFVGKTDAVVQPITVGEYSEKTDAADKIGIQLRLNQQCYCQDIYADVVAFTVVSDRWVESKFFSGVTLYPVERDGLFFLEGPWSPLPPTDRYKVELHLKCADNPDLPLKKIDFATFRP